MESRRSPSADKSGDRCVSSTVGVASAVGVGREDNGISLDDVRILDGAAAFYMTQRGA